MMYRKDPITGYKVMTISEFWKSEADKDVSGKSASELQSDSFLGGVWCMGFYGRKN